MRPALLLLAALALSACGGSDPAAPQAVSTPSASGFSADVRTNFLDSCVDNARNTAQGAVSDEQLMSTCTCILGKVEEEYSQTEFAEFEERLVGGTATDEESRRLTTWSTGCADEAAS